MRKVIKSLKPTLAAVLPKSQNKVKTNKQTKKPPKTNNMEPDTNLILTFICLRKNYMVRYWNIGTLKSHFFEKDIHIFCEFMNRESTIGCIKVHSDGIIGTHS